MKEYKRENLRITEFDKEDVIMTSTPEAIEPITHLSSEHENRYVAFNFFSKAPGAWFDD